ncbi:MULTISPECIES: hypothetical protein [unclassified Dysgonomonas]|jgi:uncharacterized membrane-anchored protein YitT (DUF2179 family)|uniref:hypothetical protein n=1 Tax=unclassified Dysgonomonas TaxID=2630389 RepID=UPI0025BBFFA3|nr:MULTISPECIES: hypothetical protein [unclassified Dysgonomonas]MDR2003570.1 hypothetical protein [Prevotella sp.]HMM03983.1 hypothetical protein [Dysgonomonas sp.]
MENQEQYAKGNKSVVSMGEWLITMLIMIIPVVNFIMLFVWAFGSNTPESKANWAKAQLVWMVIGIILVVIFWGTIAAIFVGAASR